MNEERRKSAYHRWLLGWLVDGRLFVFSVIVAQVVLVSGGGVEEKFIPVGLGNTNWL